jgi:predicted ABC-type ATPase
LRRAKGAGYEVRICYLWLPTVKLALTRIRQRVKKGGHDVPAADVRRRFPSSLRNFFQLYLPLADEALLWDAECHPPRLVAKWKQGTRKVLLGQSYERIQKQFEAA